MMLCVLCPLRAWAVPPPPVQVTANCAAPAYASDQQVCQDSELLELDRMLGELIASRNAAAAGPATAESDEEWFRRSRMCAFEGDQRDCLRAAYCLRIAWLDRAGVDLPPACAVPAADYLPASSISTSGFARKPATAQLSGSGEVLLWGFVDHGNLYGDDGTKNLLGDWWSGAGPDATSWRFNLKAGIDDPVGASFAVHVPNDLLRDDLLRVFRADAEAGRPTRVYLRGSLFSFEAPTNSGALTGLRMELSSSRDIRLE
jgi:hypothetical protein